MAHTVRYNWSRRILGSQPSSPPRAKIEFVHREPLTNDPDEENMSPEEIRMHRQNKEVMDGEEREAFERTYGKKRPLKEGVDEHEKYKDHTKNPFHKSLTVRGWNHVETRHEQNSFNKNPKYDYTEHVYNHPDQGKSHVLIWQHHDGTKSYIHRHEQSNGIMSPTTGDTRPQLEKSLDHPMNRPHRRVDEAVSLRESIIDEGYKMLADELTQAVSEAKRAASPHEKLTDAVVDREMLKSKLKNTRRKLAAVKKLQDPPQPVPSGSSDNKPSSEPDLTAKTFMSHIDNYVATKDKSHLEAAKNHAARSYAADLADAASHSRTYSYGGTGVGAANKAAKAKYKEHLNTIKRVKDIHHPGIMGRIRNAFLEEQNMTVERLNEILDEQNRLDEISKKLLGKYSRTNGISRATSRLERE